jgi:hypothetical protein
MRSCVMADGLPSNRSRHWYRYLLAQRASVGFSFMHGVKYLRPETDNGRSWPIETSNIHGIIKWLVSRYKSQPQCAGGLKAQSKFPDEIASSRE